MKSNINEVWKLIGNLTLEERKIIFKKMEQDINTQLLDLLDRVNERVGENDISMEEIIREVEEVRGYLHGEN
ncbi:MAG: hypothetical protein WCZ27_05865 [Tissierellaceae bacterium]